MNTLEKKMASILRDLKDNYFVTGVKAEFEAEGTRLEEAMRLKDVVSKAGLDLTIKIGGCEAIKDMYDARCLGVNRIVGPMVETPYALEKFLEAAKKIFPKDEMEDLELLVNVETIDGYKNFNRMLAAKNIKNLSGIVLGRVDLTGSMGLSREDINSSEEIFEITQDLLQQAKKQHLKCVVGGGVSAAALPVFKKLPHGLLDHYETRKIIFSCPGALGNQAEAGLTKAVEFELLWLKNKRDFYGLIFQEDSKRIEMLEERYNKLI